jgi:hypothetical protein
MASTSTYTMEAPAQPIELNDVSSYITKPASTLKINETRGNQLDNDPVENLPSPTTQAAEKLERWNRPKANFWRTMAAFWSFVVMGSNDAAYGALIPYVNHLEEKRFAMSELICCVVANVLQPHVCRHFTRLPFSFGRVHRICTS